MSGHFSDALLRPQTQPQAVATPLTSLDDEDYVECRDDAKVAAMHRLCEQLAQAVVMRAELPREAAAGLPAGVCALSLALAGDEASRLPSFPVMEHGRLLASALATAGVLGPGTAAWESAHRRRTLLWKASDAQAGEAPPQADWRALLEGHPTATALVTVPIAVPLASLPPAGGPALGAGCVATFALEAESGSSGSAANGSSGTSGAGAASMEELEAFGQCLGRAIAHHTKSLWEESLGFLNQVVPRRVVQRMLSAAISLVPLAAAGAPVPAVAAAAAAAAVAEAVRGGVAAAAAQQPSIPGTPCAGDLCSAATPAVRRPSPLPITGQAGGSDSGAAGKAASEECFLEAVPQMLAGIKQGWAAEQEPWEAEEQYHPESPAQRRGSYGSCSSLLTGSDAGSGVVMIKTLKRKWNLEFVDPVLEESYKDWFNTMQTRTDLRVFRYFSVLLLFLVVALALRGGMTLGDLLAVAHGVLSIAVLAAVMLFNTPWYIAHRSTLVAAVRISSAGLLLIHVYLDPAFYSGSLLKGLAGSCALTLVVNSFRNRLRFSNHLLVQLAKLYCCALANAFIFSDPSRSRATYLPLLATTLVQLGAAAVPSLAVYRLEARMRREFLHARLGAVVSLQDGIACTVSGGG